MKIQGDAETSARTGIPTYNVREEDRQVIWTINVHNLLRFAQWDQRDEPTRSLMLHNWRNGDPNSGVPEGAIVPGGVAQGMVPPNGDDMQGLGWRATADTSWLGLHAICARNALRNFLGTVTAPERVFKTYAAGPVAGWMGWIEVNGHVVAWVTTNGVIIDDARINYGPGPDDTVVPLSFTDVDGTGYSHATPTQAG